MKSRPQNTEFRNNPENFTHALVNVIYHMTLRLGVQSHAIKSLNN